MNLVIRRITIAVLAAALAGAVLAVPALSKGGPEAVAAKKAKKKKCKKSKKGKKSKKRKGCKRGSGTASGTGLPGEATPSSPTKPDGPTTPSNLQVAGVSVNANPVLAGTSTTGQVTIDAVAPTSGQQVNLQSSSPSRVSVPASVVVAPGQKTASFSVDTTTGGPVTATLTGSIGTSTGSTQLSVVDTASVKDVKLQRECFTLGTFSSNHVSLDVPAPEDTVVNLQSSDALSLSVVPPITTVPAGSANALFNVNALLPTASVTVTATLGTSNAADTASVSALAPDPKATEVSLSPESIVAGDFTTGTVTLDCEAPDGGVSVALHSSDGSDNVTVPASVTVPAGALSANFRVDTDLTTASGDYTISATAGEVTKSAQLTVNNLGT